MKAVSNDEERFPLLLVINKPAEDHTRSEAADVAGIARCCCAKALRVGYFNLFDVQNPNTSTSVGSTFSAR